MYNNLSNVKYAQSYETILNRNVYKLLQNML